MSSLLLFKTLESWPIGVLASSSIVEGILLYSHYSNSTKINGDHTAWQNRLLSHGIIALR
jgi:hypothetical protein